MANYAVLQIQEVIKRIEGVGSVQIFGASEYSMRLWLEPRQAVLARVDDGDVINAVQAQNVQVAAGTLGAEPAPQRARTSSSLVNTKGRLTDPKEFERHHRQARQQRPARAPGRRGLRGTRARRPMSTAPT